MGEREGEAEGEGEGGEEGEGGGGGGDGGGEGVEGNGEVVEGWGEEDGKGVVLGGEGWRGGSRRRNRCGDDRCCCVEDRGVR